MRILICASLALFLAGTAQAADPLVGVYSWETGRIRVDETSPGHFEAKALFDDTLHACPFQVVGQRMWNLDGPDAEGQYTGEIIETDAACTSTTGVPAIVRSDDGHLGGSVSVCSGEDNCRFATRIGSADDAAKAGTYKLRDYLKSFGGGKCTPTGNRVLGATFRDLQRTVAEPAVTATYFLNGKRVFGKQGLNVEKEGEGIYQSPQTLISTRKRGRLKLTLKIETSELRTLTARHTSPACKR